MKRIERFGERVNVTSPLFLALCLVCVYVREGCAGARFGLSSSLQNAIQYNTFYRRCAFDKHFKKLLINPSILTTGVKRLDYLP